MPQENDLFRPNPHFASNLRQALPYLEEFHGESFIIKLSGDLLEQENCAQIMEDITLLHRIGIRIILVHGAYPQIEKAVSSSTKRIQKHLLQLSLQILAEVNWKLLQMLQRQHGKSFAVSGFFLRAETCSQTKAPETLSKLNKLLGRVTSIDTSKLEQLLEHGDIPIISPVAPGADTQMMLLDPNAVAVEIASTIRAKKLIILDSYDLPFDATGVPIRDTTTSEMKHWLQHHSEESSTANYIHHLVEACERGVERCHLVNNQIDGGILHEILSPQGLGTLITNSDYRCIRQAQPQDMHKLKALLQPAQESLHLVSKPFSEVRKNIEHIWLFFS